MGFLGEVELFFRTLVGLTVLLVLLDAAHVGVEIDGCMYPRFLSQAPPPTVLGPYEFQVATTLLFASLLLLCFLDPSRSYHIALSVFLYASSNVMLEALKSFLGDSTCSHHPNSISGHASFFLYYSMILFYFRDIIIGSISSPSVELIRPSWLFSVGNLAVFLFWVFAGSTLVSTLRGGYHSFRQMLYGFVWGSFSFYCILLGYRKASHPLFVWLSGLFLLLICAAFHIFLPSSRFPLGLSDLVLLLLAFFFALFSRSFSLGKPSRRPPVVVPKTKVN